MLLILLTREYCCPRTPEGKLAVQRAVPGARAQGVREDERFRACLTPVLDQTLGGRGCRGAAA